jgi:hypothetical protein
MHRHSAVRFGFVILLSATWLILMFAPPSSSAALKEATGTSGVKGAQATANIWIGTSTDFLPFFVDGIRHQGTSLFVFEIGSVHNVEYPEMVQDADSRWYYVTGSSGYPRVYTWTVTENTSLVVWYQLYCLLDLRSDWGNPYCWSVQGIRADSWPDLWCKGQYDATFFITSPDTESVGKRHSFVEWRGTGDNSYTGPNQASGIKMYGPRTEEAIWRTEFLLSAAADSTGGGSVEIDSVGGGIIGKDTAGVWLDSAAVVNVGAIPQHGYRFLGWAGDTTSADSILTMTMNRPMTLRGRFESLNLHRLSTGVDPESGGIVDPDSGIYPGRADFSMTAIPAPGFVFLSWNGDLSGTENPGKLCFDADKQVTARFGHTLETAADPPAAGSVAADRIQPVYEHGSTLVLTAIPAEGYAFEAWEIDSLVTVNPLTVVFDRNLHAVAKFRVVSGVLSESRMPFAFGLSQNYPNPFNPVTRIPYAAAENRTIRLEVYNPAGRLVRTLFNGEVRIGRHEAVWDGRDDAGTMVPAGIYLVRMQAGDRVFLRKMSLVK